MGRYGRRQQARAASAIADVVHDAVLAMRTMAHTGETMFDDIFPDIGCRQQIREIADLCDNLIPGLRHGGPRRPTDALQYTWDSRSEAQQQWLRRSLASHGVRVEDLINTAADRQHVQPN